MHAQTLRTYDRLGLVTPARTSGGGRRYSTRRRTAARIQRLSQEEGVSLAGIKRIIELTREVDELRARIGGISAPVETPTGRAVRPRWWCGSPEGVGARRNQ